MRFLIWLWALAMPCCLAAAPAADADRQADPAMLKQVREEFAGAVKSGAVALNLIEQLDGRLPIDRTQWPPVFLAYRAALEGLAGQHSLRPWVKYNRAKAGLAQFKGLAEAYPDSIEIRMLRYSTCSQLPDFFKMRPQAETDLAALVGLLEQNSDPGVPAALRQGYVQWILDKGQPAPEVRQRLETLSKSLAQP
jgi:hypothetical protein